ncbi:MAG TPA: hypothetical protein VKA46_18645 [Gemmataceae bacterium]|nr:hypothetical protein [Gemmataceae bacterium]
MSDPTTRSVPASLPVGDLGKPVVYRPLAILAVVGAGVGGLYAAVVILGGLVAFFRGDPWLLPGWSALFPIAGAALSLLGLLQIQRSEGTLAGEKAARWGLLLSALVGLSYWAYVGVIYYAIYHEASQFSDDFLKKLTRNEIPPVSAFRLTLPPSERPAEGDKLRDELEGRFNVVPEMGRKGFLSTFAQSEAVRVLAVGGADTTIEALGVDDWSYVGGGYQVRLQYRVSTPQMSFVLELTVQGKEGKRSQGRQWYIVWDKLGMKSDPSPQMSDEGKQLFMMGQASRERLGAGWLRVMREGQTEVVFLDTLPEAERDGTRRSALNAGLGLWLADGFAPGALPCSTPGAVLIRGALAVRDPARVGTLPGFDEFLAGGLVRAEKDVFWAPQGIRDEIITLVRQEFREPGEQLANALMPDASARVPLVRREGDRIVVESEVMMRVPSSGPRFGVEGRLVLECEASQTPMPLKSWRVRELILLSGKSLPAPPGMPTGRPTGMAPGS